jgi:hypothetical protein
MDSPFRFRRIFVSTILMLAMSLLAIVPVSAQGTLHARTNPLNIGVAGKIALRGIADLYATAGGQNALTNVEKTREESPLQNTGVAGQAAETVPARDVSIQGNFTGLSLSDDKSITGHLFLPPDVQIAAGPSASMELVNQIAGVFDKHGTRVAAFDSRTLFMTGSHFVEDPQVLFDNMSRRFFASAIDTSSSSIVVAVSTTIDPAKSFCVFSVSISNTLDAEKSGISDDKFVVAADVFNGNVFVGNQFWVLNKSELTACSTTVDFVSFGPDKSVLAVHPVQSLTATTTLFMVATTTSGSQSLVLLYSVTGVPPGTVSASRVALSVSTIKDAPGAAVRGSNLSLLTNDIRVADAFWWNNILWLAHDNACVPSGDKITRACIHLVEISTTTATVLQDFNFGAAGGYVFYPALRPDGRGNLLVIYGFSSQSDFPGLKVTEQSTTDPRNTLETPLLLQTGQGTVALRYGDYFGAATDPSNPSIVWVAGEYGSGVVFSDFPIGWATQIGTITG